MKTNAGLWIDHREAILVMLTETGEETTEETTRILSHEEEQFQAHRAEADDSREREHTGHLARYYDEIIAALSPAESVFIFGPGEAKGELNKRFEKHPKAAPRIALETTDKMTEPQIVAFVRHHFHRDPLRQ